jgi:hypothetical protein
MITVFEGFMVISGAVSGNVVLNEAEGWPALSMVRARPGKVELTMAGCPTAAFSGCFALLPPGAQGCVQPRPVQIGTCLGAATSEPLARTNLLSMLAPYTLAQNLEVRPGKLFADVLSGLIGG